MTHPSRHDDDPAPYPAPREPASPGEIAPMSSLKTKTRLKPVNRVRKHWARKLSPSTTQPVTSMLVLEKLSFVGARFWSCPVDCLPSASKFACATQVGPSRATKPVETHMSELAGCLRQTSAIRAMPVRPNRNGGMCSLCHVNQSLDVMMGYVSQACWIHSISHFWS